MNIIKGIGRNYTCLRQISNVQAVWVDVKTTLDDLEEMGIEKLVEIALERSWDGCDAVYLSYDIDSIEAGYVPGTILAMMQKDKKVGVSKPVPIKQIIY
jgi:hypothetical protein